jgi:tight adherence protein B
MAPILIAAGVFVLAAGVIVAAYYGLSSLPALMTQRKIESRMADVTRPAEVEPKLGFELVKRQKDGPLPLVDRLVSETGAGTWLAKLIEQSGSKTGVSAVILMAGLLGVVAALGTSALVGGGLGFFPGFMFGAAIPFVVLMRKRTVRIRRFEEQFPEALDLITRAMRAGHSLTFGFQMVGDELPDPIGSEFAQVAEEIKLGRELRVALGNLVYRVEAGDLPFFVTAITIQRETGGNLAEVLEKLSKLIRERFALYGKVRALTAIGKASANLLASMPILLVTLLYTCGGEGGRSYVSPLYTTTPGMMLSAVALGFVVIGYIMCRRMAQIEV